MKLYYSPGACSLASHIVAREAGIPLELDKTDLRAKTTASGADFSAINPKGYVPALALDSGELLTEGTAILQFLADQKPELGLIPAAGSMARYRLLEWLGYINSELHKSFSPLFNPATSDAVRAERADYLRRRYQLVEQHLDQHPYLLGEQFSVADAYLYTVTNWANYVKLDLSDFPKLQDYQQRIAARPAVQDALRAEHLIK